MYKLEKDIIISCSHHLEGYKGACKRVHGHNFRITVYCKDNKLDKIGMLIDFKEIKSIVSELDHKDLNQVLSFNPTAENLAEHLCNRIPFCYKVMVQESEGSRCYYEKDD